MAYPLIIRNYNAFVDGVSYFGIVREGKLPDLKINTAAHRGTGMDGPVGVDMGLEAMQAEMIFAEWPSAILKMVGTIQSFVYRPAARADDGREAGYIATCKGLLVSAAKGNLKPGEESLLTARLDLRQYRLEQDGEVLWDIDLETGKRSIGGVDQNATLRANMGL